MHFHPTIPRTQGVAKTLRRALSLAFVCLVLTGSGPAAAAEEFTLAAGETLPAMLGRLKDKPVTLQLFAGGEITGRIRNVGDGLVHLTEIRGRELFDAIVPVDKVVAVLFRGR